MITIQIDERSRGRLLMLRQQLRQHTKQIVLKVVTRLMYWTDSALNAENSPDDGLMASPPAATSDEDEVEAELSAALTRSQKIAEKPQAPRPVDIQVYVDSTPNPNAMKFTVSTRILDSGSLSFANADQAKGNPMGEQMFAIEGVEGMFAINDFCTITKAPMASWTEITQQVEAILLETAL
jgi:hypothetical protein